MSMYAIMALQSHIVLGLYNYKLVTDRVCKKLGIDVSSSLPRCSEIAKQQLTSNTTKAQLLHSNSGSAHSNAINSQIPLNEL
jgi:hypothetical protein